MSKGTGIAVAVLVGVLAAIGGWLAWESARAPQKKGLVVTGVGGRAEAPRLGNVGDRRAADPTLPENRFEEGEVLVLNPPDGFEAAARQLGYSIVERVRLAELGINLVRVRIPSGTDVPRAKRELAQRFPGLGVDANHHFENQGVEDYPRNLPRAIIGWKKATPQCGTGVKLGMVDAPIDVKHQALAGQNVEFRSFHRDDRRPAPADHGTAVAAMLVGKPDWGGLLPGAELKAANMFEMNEVGKEVGNALAMLKGLNWLIESGVHAINLSVAGADNKAVRTAIEKAGERRVAMVAAAGNWASADRPAFPAAYDDTIAVTAFGENRVVYAQANQGAYIDFAAPGVQIYTAVPGGGRLQSGTSFAAPFLSVLIGLDVAKSGSTSVNALIKRLQPSSVDLGKSGRDDIFGWGFVSVEPDCRT